MGMFDDITYTAPCPYCGQPITGWQSKNAGCNLSRLTPKELWEQRTCEPWEVRFYCDCDNCGSWVTVTLDRRAASIAAAKLLTERKTQP